jgi:RNA polymerase sigma-70 factor (ECF subfamily)
MPALWRYIRARLPGDGSAAEDILSETFLAAIRDLRRFDGHKGSVAGWLTGIARHKLADLRRGPVLAPLQTDSLTCHSSAPWEPMRHRELREQVREAMLLLDDDERLVLDWKYIEGLSINEIARRLGRSEKGVEALLYRARNEFRRQFHPDGEPEKRR